MYIICKFSMFFIIMSSKNLYVITRYPAMNNIFFEPTDPFRAKCTSNPSWDYGQLWDRNGCACFFRLSPSPLPNCNISTLDVIAPKQFLTASVAGSRPHVDLDGPGIYLRNFINSEFVALMRHWHEAFFKLFRQLQLLMKELQHFSTKENIQVLKWAKR